MYYTLDDLRADLARDSFGVLEQTPCNGSCWEQLDTTPLKSREPKYQRKHFNVGDAVIVTTDGYKFSNQVGIIRNIRGGTAHVMFETGDSSYRLERLDKWDLPITDELRIRVYRIKPELIRLYNIKINKKEQTERKENKMAKLTGFKKIAVINFGGGRDYNYALYDDTIVKGDMVVVSGNAENQLVEVKDVVDVTSTTNTDYITAEVIAKVDMTAYNKRVEDRQRKAELMRLMDKKIAEAKEVDKYAEYAKFLGDDFAKMFEEFKSL